MSLKFVVKMVWSATVAYWKWESHYNYSVMDLSYRSDLTSRFAVVAVDSCESLLWLHAAVHLGFVWIDFQKLVVVLAIQLNLRAGELNSYVLLCCSYVVNSHCWVKLTMMSKSVSELLQTDSK